MSEGKYTDQQLDAVRDAVADALGDAYDCTRVWQAWHVGTMSQNDFQLVTDNDDRVDEIAVAALDASGVAGMVEALQIILANVPMQSAYQALIHEVLKKANGG